MYAATSFVPTEGQTSHDIIINGDMSVDQRGASDTSNNYYTTVDRWNYARLMDSERKRD